MSIEETIKQQVLQSPELATIIDQRAEYLIRTRDLNQHYTREELSVAWKISKQSIDRMSDEEMYSQGFRRKKIGGQVRFEKLPLSPRETFERVKRNNK